MSIIKNSADTVYSMLQRLISWVLGLLRLPSTYDTTEMTVRKRVQDLLSMYSGEQLSLLQQTLKAQFSNPNSLSLQPEFSNIVRYITDSLNQTFRNGMLFTPEEEVDTEIWDEIIESTDIDAVMQEVEKLTFLCGTTFVKIGWRQGHIALDLITPEFTEIKARVDNPYDIENILYPVDVMKPNVDNPKGIFGYFSPTEFYYIDEGGRILDNPGNPNNENPYAPVIPIQTFRDKLPSNALFFNWPGQELEVGQMSLNVKLTSLNQLIKFQSFGVPLFINPPTDLKGNISVIVDPSRPIVIQTENKDKQADFKFVTPNAAITDVQASIDKEYQRIFAFYGLSPSEFIASGQKSSAEAAKEYHAKINEFRDAHRTIYIPQISELLDRIMVVWNVNNPTRQLKASCTVRILESNKGYSSKAEETAYYDWAISKGLMNSAEILTQEYDDLTESEAVETIKYNKQLEADLNSLAPEAKESEVAAQKTTDTTSMDPEDMMDSEDDIMDTQ